MVGASVSALIRCCGLPKIVTPPGCIAIDPHVHTSFSKCSISQVEQIIMRAVRMGLRAIGIMDHNIVTGAGYAVTCADELKRRKLIPEDFLIIPGTEIACGSGQHIGALFLEEPIPKKQGVDATVQKIHDMGGLAVAVHPYLSSGIGDALFDAPFDAVEIESGSVLRHDAAERAHLLANDDRLGNLAKLGSSDAHHVVALGMCYTVIRTDSVTLESLRSAITQGLSTPHTSGTYVKLRKLAYRLPALR